MARKGEASHGRAAAEDGAPGEDAAANADLDDVPARRADEALEEDEPTGRREAEPARPAEDGRADEGR